MAPIDPGSAREFLEAVIAGFSVLGGSMAYSTGLAAYRSLVGQDSATKMAHRIDMGMGEGFIAGAPFAIFSFTLMAWTP